MSLRGDKLVSPVRTQSIFIVFCDYSVGDAAYLISCKSQREAFQGLYCS